MARPESLHHTHTGSVQGTFSSQQSGDSCELGVGDDQGKQPKNCSLGVARPFTNQLQGKGSKNKHGSLPVSTKPEGD